jgi:hypothetical protein
VRRAGGRVVPVGRRAALAQRVRGNEAVAGVRCPCVVRRRRRNRPDGPPVRSRVVQPNQGPRERGRLPAPGVEKGLRVAHVAGRADDGNGGHVARRGCLHVALPVRVRGPRLGPAHGRRGCWLARARRRRSAGCHHPERHRNRRRHDARDPPRASHPPEGRARTDRAAGDRADTEQQRARRTRTRATVSRTAMLGSRSRRRPARDACVPRAVARGAAPSLHGLPPVLEPDRSARSHTETLQTPPAGIGDVIAPPLARVALRPLRPGGGSSSAMRRRRFHRLDAAPTTGVDRVSS